MSRLYPSSDAECQRHMADSPFLWHLQVIPSRRYGGREGGGGSVFLALGGVPDSFLLSVATMETVFPCAWLVWG